MDLRKFLEQLDSLKELEMLEGADWNLEIGAITELSDEKNGPALLFDKIKGYPAGHRVVSNLLGTPRRWGVAFGLPSDIGPTEIVLRAKQKLTSLRPVAPVEVSTGPVLENVQEGDDVDMLSFPVPKWHEYDGGRYIGTADMIITRDPQGGWVNVGTYRIQLHDRRTLGWFTSPGQHGRQMREAYWAQGKACPVAAVFGAHPLVWMPSFLTLPWGSSELEMVGGLLGEPLQVIKGKLTGLPVPAHGEIVIEGECPPPTVETREEGPFGEWPGYYGSGVRKEAVIRVKRVMYRRNPVIVGVPPLKPPASANATYIVKSAQIWSEIEKLGIPGIKGVWCNRSGGGRYLTIVSIEQKYAGHARQVAMAAMACPTGAQHGRFVVVVDEDIDPSNEEDVLWALCSRCDPAEHIETVRNCWTTPLDPTLSPEKRAAGNISNSRAMLLACKPYYWKKDFPRVNRASDELREQTRNKWKARLPGLAR
ncbi:MAG: UbiD family decarboxylase [Chloroflexi bacterium]|nr:UbiD family decarboxylase [Chloroflexota bacterium]